MTEPDPTPSDSASDLRPDFRPGQVVTVFRSRLRADAGPDYADTAAEMARLAAGMPGLVDVTAFTAQDDHRAAQQAGRDRFYAEYSLQVCETRRVRRFP